ncbi:MAG: ABC transporter substrate binding protein [bacterium]
MKKIFILAMLLTVGAFGASGAAPSPDVVVLLSDSAEDIRSVSKSFQSEFGKEVEVINLEGSDIKQKKEGEKLEARGPDLVVVVVGDLAAQAAKWYLAEVPVVYCSSFRAAEFSLTDMNAVGVYHETSPSDQLAGIKELFPEAEKVGLLYAPEYSQVKLSRIKSRARSRGIDLEVSPCKNVKEIPAKLKSLMPRVDLLWVLTDPQVLSKHSNQFIIKQSISSKVPVFCGEKRLGRAGAAAALVPSAESVGRTAARQAKKVAGGKTPEPGDVVYSEGELIINRKMTENLNIKLAPGMIEKAAQVIE